MGVGEGVADLLPDLAAPGLIPSIPVIFQGKFVDAAEVNQKRCLEESRQKCLKMFFEPI